MFTVNIQSLLGFNNTQEQFVHKAMKKFETVMNSAILKQRIIDFTCVLGQRFEDNQGLSNQQVYEKLIAAAETYNPSINFQADLFLNLKRKNKPWFSRNPAIGFGSPGTKEITTYTWWFNSATEPEYAGHIAHEWVHKVGFDHEFNPTATRPFSVPYAFGNIIEKLAGNL
jgi:hypothetical protein